MKRLMVSPIYFLLMLLFYNIQAYTADWPKVIKTKGSVNITMYQPQIESFEKNILESRAAIMVKSPKLKDPVWGAVWINAKVSTDMDTRMIDLEDVQVTSAKFPGQDSAKINELRTLLASEISGWKFNMTIEQLSSSLELEKENAQEKFNFTPPEIIYVEHPAILVSIDGEPQLRKLEETGYQYVINSPFFIAKDKNGEAYYLKGPGLWYKSNEILKGWQWTDKVPSDLLNFVKSKSKEDEPKVNPDTIKVKPEIIVRTKAAELVETKGKAELATIKGTSLLFVKNTESDIIVDINSQMHYILISGRWFSAKSMEGPWTFIEPDSLPADFANIPSGSDLENVLANVPGTPEAKDAVLDAQIPQTAKVDRKKTIEVKYDGEPEFEDIEDTDLEYAVNTDKSVIKFEDKYYCCDNAIWYESISPKGPWKVADAIPDEIYKMTPESPVYNTKYVYVYDSTPEVVYTGYYPGYTGSYVYGGCVIYGTGWYYPPYYGAYYYPRPVTYGFSVHYNPYYGWSFGFGMSFGGPMGWFSIGIGMSPYYGGYWGAGGYHAGYHHGYHQGLRAGYIAGSRNNQVGHYNDGNRNIYNREGGEHVSTRDRQRSGGSVSTNDQQRNRNNVSTNDQQRNRNNVSTNDQQRTRNNVSTNDRQGAGAKNDVFTDKQGNVYKRENNEWKQREGNNWSSVDKSKDRSSFERNQQDLNRQSASRDRGNYRSQNYAQQRSSMSRGGGGRGGGGGRRR